MATNSYIQRDATILPSANGKRLMLNIVSIRRTKGTPTTDLPIPSKSSSLRQLLPLAGQVNDFQITALLETESSNIGYTVTAGGSTSSDSILTIKDQYNYLYDTLLSEDINKKYRLYIDWLDKTFVGQITIDSTASERDFSGAVDITINFKEGGNFLST